MMIKMQTAKEKYSFLWQADRRELQHLSFLRKGRRSLTSKHKKLPPDVGVPQKFRFLLIWLLFGFYDKQ